MAKLQNGKMMYESGEELPAVGSAEYEMATTDPESLVNFKKANPGLSFTDEEKTYYDNASPITLSSLEQKNPMKLSIPKPLTGSADLEGLIEGGVNAYTSERQKNRDFAEQKSLIKAKQSSLDKSREALVERLTGEKTETGMLDEAYAETVDPAQKELDDINNEILSEQLATKRRIEAIDKTYTGTLEGKNDEIERVKRESLSRRADLSVIQMAKQGRYDSAKAIADRKVKMSLEKDAQEIELLKFDYLENKEQFTKDEQRQFERETKEREREYAKKDAELKTISDLSIEALRGGAPANIAAKMRTALSADEAMRIGGQYIGSLERQKSALELLKLKNEVTANAPVTGEWASVINGASGLVSNTKRQTVKTNIVNAIASEDYETAYAEIANAVSDGLTGTNKTKFDDANTDIGVMQGLRSAIQAYADAGGDMGLLKGKAEDIKRKLGIDSGKATQLAVQLWREFQTYRNNMTGAAFTDKESSDYASVNPTLGKELDLNLNVIDGAIGQLSNRVQSTIERRLPDAKKIREKMQEQNASKLDAKARVIELGRTNPTLQGQIKTLMSSNDATLGRPLTYEEVLQIINPI